MINMENIKKLDNGLISMDCHVIDNIKQKNFNLVFDPVSLKIYSDTSNIDLKYARHAIAYVYYRLKEGNLKDHGTTAWV